MSISLSTEHAGFQKLMHVTVVVNTVHQIYSIHGLGLR
jgi:hypothetical protein